MVALMNYPILFLLKCSLLTLIIARGTNSSNSDYAPCRFNHYFDAAEGRCKKCSSCPTNHITIQPCSNIDNVKCRPYTLRKIPSAKTDNSDFKFSSNFKSSSNSNIVNKDRTRSDLTRGKINIENGKKSPAPINSELNNEEDNYWKTLAFALIGLLSVLIITTFIILIFVYKKLQKSIVITQTEEADLMDDADSGYVVIRAIHHMATPRADNHPLLSLYPRDQTTDSHPPPPPHLPPSHPASIDSGRPADSLSISTPGPADDSEDNQSCFLPKTYQPQRRLLNYDADDVFESDDNTSVNRHLSDPKQKLQALIDDGNHDKS